MVRGKRGHAPCKTSPKSSKSWETIIEGAKLPKCSGGWHLSTTKKEGVVPHPRAYKLSLHYDGRTGERFGVRVGTYYLGSLSGKGGYICEELRKRMIDVCYLQERWRGQGDRMLGKKGRRHKLW